MLEVVNLELHRGPQRWLHNFSVPDGGALALMGPSGSGKTTLLEALGGFVPIVQGEIRVNAVPVQALPAEQRPVSTLFQEHNLFEHISVRANLRLGFGQGPPTAAQWSVIEAACEHLGIAALLDQGPSELSGGQRQRVALVRAVLRPQPVILLDEPFSALDGANRDLAGHWLRHVAADQGKTLVFVTHQMSDAEQWSDQVIRLPVGG